MKNRLPGRHVAARSDAARGGALFTPDIPGDEFDGIVQELRDLGRVPAPQPSPELEALLTKGLPNLHRLRRSRRRRVLVGAVLAGSVSMSLTGIAAANDQLPGRSQDVVAGVINELTPFHVPDRDSRPGIPGAPRDTPTRRTPTHPRPSEGSGDDGEVRSPQPGGAAVTPGDDDAHPSPTPTRTEHESEPRPGSSTTPWQPSGTETTEHDHWTSGSSTPQH